MPTFAEIAIRLQPLLEALEHIAGKEAAASWADSEAWAEVPLAIRERSFFTATVANLKTVQELQERMEQAVAGASDESGIMSQQRFVRDMKLFLGAGDSPADTGDIADIASGRRLRLIFDTQTQDAAAYARWKAESTEAHLDNFPAQELVRNEGRRIPRDWEARWQMAGGKFYEGRMIAAKDDPIWAEISRFERPWPPFDFNSGMGVEDVEREEAERLGVIAPDQEVTSPEAGFNASLRASVSSLGEEARALLTTSLGGRATLTGDIATLAQ
jgi:hypothetical protein